MTLQPSQALTKETFETTASDGPANEPSIAPEQSDSHLEFNTQLKHSPLEIFSNQPTLN